VTYDNELLNFRISLPAEWQYEVFEEENTRSMYLQFNDVRQENAATEALENIGMYLSIGVMNRADYQALAAGPDGEGMISYEAVIDDPTQDVVYRFMVNNAFFTTDAAREAHLDLVKQVYNSFELLIRKKAISFPLDVPKSWVTYENAELNIRMYLPSEWQYEVVEEKSATATYLLFNDVRAEDPATDKLENIGMYLSVGVMNRADYQALAAAPGGEGMTSFDALIDDPTQEVVYNVVVNNAFFTTDADKQTHLRLVEAVYSAFELLDPNRAISYPLNGR
jgi:hypothetical protein